MPNCDFYATDGDHELLLDYIFDESLVEVYELSSDFDKPLKQFHSTGEVMKEFDRTYTNGNKWSSLHLQLYVLGSSHKFKPTKVFYKNENCDKETFKYKAEGYGLIQLYLSVPDKGLLSNSHTNHNTKKRAETWARTEIEIEEVAAWDFDVITKYSSKLNRYIRKLSVGKITSRPVLSNAYKLWNNGADFGPYKSSEHSIKLK